MKYRNIKNHVNGFSKAFITNHHKISFETTADLFSYNLVG